MLENNHTIHLTLNGESRAFTVEPQETLLHVLRERAHLTGAKKGCDLGECGACTVIMDGCAVNSCCVFAIEADGSTVETIEGIGHRRRAAPAAAGVYRRRRHPVRLLHARNDHGGQGAARPQLPSHARGDPRRHVPATSAAARATRRSRRPSSRLPGSLTSTRTERGRSSDGAASFRHCQPRYTAP